MINRELIRNKVVQLTYAYYQNGSKNIDSAEKELFFSLSKAYDLYNHLLSLMAAVSKEAALWEWRNWTFDCIILNTGGFRGNIGSTQR